MSSVNDSGSESEPSQSMPCSGPWGTVLLEVMTFTTGCRAGSKPTYACWKKKKTATLFFSKSKNILPVLWATSSSPITVNVQNAVSGGLQDE